MSGGGEMKKQNPQSSAVSSFQQLAFTSNGINEADNRPFSHPASSFNTGLSLSLCKKYTAREKFSATVRAVLRNVRKVLPVLLLACLEPVTQAYGSYDFTPVLRQSGVSWISGQAGGCEEFLPRKFDINQRHDMQHLASELAVKEQQLLEKRAAHGIYHEIHTPVLENMADLALQMQDTKTAQEYKEAVLLIKQRLYQSDGIALAKAYSQWADWHFDRYLENLGRPSVLLGSGHDSLLLTLHFSVSNEFYTRAIKLLDDESVSSCERNSIVTRLKALYFVALRYATMPVRDYRLPGDIDYVYTFGGVVPYSISGDSLRVLLFKGHDSTKVGDPEKAKDSALQMVELADWYSLFNNKKDARTNYEKAWHTLDSVGFTQEEIETTLTFGLPIREPDAPLKLRNNASIVRGYIDVNVELNAQGLPTAVNLMGSDKHEVKLVRSLMRKIWDSRFRPVVRDGSSSDKELVELRYMY
jgi:hypothetical protein